MSHQIKKKIIILRKVKYGESDLIIQGLSSEGEKISCLARGALRSKKRFAGGVLEPTHFVEVQLRLSSQAERMSTLEEATLLEDFMAIRSDYDRIEFALELVDFIAKVSQEGDSFSHDLFNLLGNALRGLQTVESLSQFKIHFGLRFLHQQGVLQVEDWMKPYLALSLVEHNRLPKQDVSNSKINWIHSELQTYVKTAGLDPI